MRQANRTPSRSTVLALALALAAGKSTAGVGPAAHADAGAPGDPAPPTATIEIEAYDTMRFSRRVIEVRPGSRLRFVVTNKGRIPHEFTVGSAAEQAAHAAAMQRAGHGEGEAMAHDGAGALDLLPGETKSMVVSFARPGVVELACNYPGHYQAGMTIEVRVG